MSVQSLSTVIALARAGAIDHAWQVFAESGHDRRADDPAALTVKGRLLKDRALRAEGEERRRFYLQSAEAYRQSAVLKPGTYPLINAATLSLLSGDRGQAEALAREVLERIAREPDEPETPYWKAATESEALLLLGRADDALAALRRAIAAAPQAWEDHASTLRQFLAIHEALGLDPAALDMLRPPRSVHYRGEGEAVVKTDERRLRRELGELLESARCGFGFGSLRPGGDIRCAEALIERGLPLHVVLPVEAGAFAARIADTVGNGWRQRFEAALAVAETVQLVRPLDVRADRARVELGEEIALGSALLNAERLMSDALRLVVGTKVDAGHGQLKPARSSGSSPADPASAAEDARETPLAMLALAIGTTADPRYEARLQGIRALLGAAEEAVIAPHLSGDCILIGYRTPADAVEVAQRVRAGPGADSELKLAAHYGLTACVRDPFHGALRPTESGAAIVRSIADATPPGTACVSEDFAAVLAARSPGPSGASWIGELEARDGGAPIGLYALGPGSS